MSVKLKLELKQVHLELTFRLSHVEHFRNLQPEGPGPRLSKLLAGLPVTRFCSVNFSPSGPGPGGTWPPAAAASPSRVTVRTRAPRCHRGAAEPSRLRLRMVSLVPVTRNSPARSPT